MSTFPYDTITIVHPSNGNSRNSARTMPRNRFLDSNWRESHLRSIKKKAGHRYTPELNVELPIAVIFDGISRTTNFYHSIRTHYGNLQREFSSVSVKYENGEELQQLYNALSNKVTKVLHCLSAIKQYDTKEIPWDEINVETHKASQIAWDLLSRIRREQDRNKSQKIEHRSELTQPKTDRLASDTYYLDRTQRELRYFEEFSSSTGARVSNCPLLLLTGDAGTGKTHLLCDVVEHRAASKAPLPAVLVFGELFTTTEDPFTQIIRQLCLRLTTDRFLALLNNAGKQSGCRAIVAIDALNETPRMGYWKRNLGRIVREITRYPNIALIVSVRMGFEEELITKELNKTFVREEHHGFQFREWEAINKFFGEFHLPLPEIPLLMPEFQNPLFLLLFCKAFQGRAKENSGNKRRQIFRGHEGATYIFESFVDAVSKRIARQFKLATDPGKNIWDAVIERVAAEMVNRNTDRIPEQAAVSLVRAAYPSIDGASFLRELERNLLIVKVPRYSAEKHGYDGFDFRFPFQKFSDHLVGRYLFKKYEQEFGKQNKNPTTAKRFFSRRRRLGRFLANSWHRGIVEALSIQCPEHLEGCEFVEVAPYLSASQAAEDAFVESLVWRKPTAFSPDMKNTLAYINARIIRTRLGHDNLLNAFLSVAPIPDHPFNADFLHKHLSKFSMAKRDSWWSTFLHYQHGEQGAVDRLIEWGWSAHDKAYVGDEPLRLCAVALCWFLTTPNRFLRDKATKALVALLTNRLGVVLSLLSQFKDVNDPYVAERLYAVAYGCAIRSRKDRRALMNLSKWVYENVFRHGDPPAHILIRDYARGIIEVALQEKMELKIERSMIEPPFHSAWPRRVPSQKWLKSKYYPESFFEHETEKRGFLDIWSSVMYSAGTLGDFGNYVLDSAVNYWSGRRLNGREANRKALFSDFKSSLTKQQRRLLETATNPFFGISLKSILSLMDSTPTDERRVDTRKGVEQQEQEQKVDIERALADFEHSLPARKKALFDNEIKPFLNDRGGISDPLESFDTGLAQRWVFNRVVELGWDEKLHGEFDRNVNSYRTDRSEHKPERIGKKYQWIALRELLARISDNFEFKGDGWSDRPERYEGPWQLSVRDIDPSCILKEPPNVRPEGVPGFSNTEIQQRYDAWDRKTSDSAWLKDSEDLPDPKLIIESVDEKGNSWVMLEAHVQWQEETPPEHEKYNIPTRTLWYMLKSYLVRSKDKDKVLRWAQRQRFMNRWMPESGDLYHVYLGEYPWAPAFLYHCTPSYHRHGWTSGTGDRKTPAGLLVTDDHYVSSGSSIDCSTDDVISVKLPARYIVDRMKLSQPYMDGRFFDKHGDLVTFDPGMFDETFPRCVLTQKGKLCEFLEHEGYGILWTLLGEKNMVGGGVIGQPLGWLEINGAFTLDDRSRVRGVKKTIFRKST